MSLPPKCCNPFNKKGHSNYREKLTLLSNNYHKKFSALFSSHVCNKCKAQLYRQKDEIQFLTLQQEKCSENSQIISESVADIKNEKQDDEEPDSLGNDHDFKCTKVDEQCKRQKLLNPLEQIILNPSTSKLNLSSEEKSILIKSIEKSSGEIFSNDEMTGWIEDLKIALSKATDRREKIFLLTTFPVKWSVRKISRTFGVSRRMINAAKKLHDTKGYGTQPSNKKGRPLEAEIMDKVKRFYLSDEISRMMPGAKDFKSVVIDGKRHHKTVNCFTKTIFFQVF